MLKNESEGMKAVTHNEMKCPLVDVLIFDQLAKFQQTSYFSVGFTDYLALF